MQSRFLIVVMVLLTAGCIDQTSIQGRYAREHEECRSYAESHIERYLPKDHEVSADDRNAQLVTLFSDCMGKKGWQVAKPKRADEGTATTDNSIPPEPSPAARQAPATAAQQQPPQAVPTQNTPLSPGLNQPVPDGAATYSPAYGTGPGRNF